MNHHGSYDDVTMLHYISNDCFNAMFLLVGTQEAMPGINEIQAVTFDHFNWSAVISSGHSDGKAKTANFNI